MTSAIPGTKNYLEINHNVAEYVIAVEPSSRVVYRHFFYPLLISCAFFQSAVEVVEEQGGLPLRPDETTWSRG